LALGHSNASYEEANEAFHLGATGVTHLFNAMSGLTGRNPGLIGAALNNPSCYVALIADLYHVHHANISITSKLKANHTYLVTDAFFSDGMGCNHFDYYGKNYYAKEGKCIDEAGNIGGSMITLSEAVKNCVE
jgi:N-acetylglucosamine-6-phosphate deacetylase